MDVRRLLSFIPLLVAALAVPGSSIAAQNDETPTEETVANLAAGRVVIAVVKNAIFVATVENPIEVETHPPIPVPLSTERLGVILGPVQWWSPSSKVELARLDQELPHLRSHLIAANPHLQAAEGGTEATDIEGIGQGLLERLNDVAQNLHGKVDLPSNEPILQLIVADYLPGYGAEVWQLGYGMKQEEQEPGYWTTRILRPSYLQFWPPEKGQPRTLVEFAYPPEGAQQSLIELLRQKDPRLEKVVASDAKMAEAADLLLKGESNKILAADATQFLRAALDAIAPPNARETMAMITEEKGYEWILPPPLEPKTTISRPERSADAPTLMKPPQ